MSPPGARRPPLSLAFRLARGTWATLKAHNVAAIPEVLRRNWTHLKRLIDDVLSTQFAEPV